MYHLVLKTTGILRSVLAVARAVVMSELRYDGRVAVVTGAGGGQLFVRIYSNRLCGARK